jgi:hypothetical protein
LQVLIDAIKAKEADVPPDTRFQDEGTLQRLTIIRPQLKETLAKRGELKTEFGTVTARSSELEAWISTKTTELEALELLEKPDAKKMKTIKTGRKKRATELGKLALAMETMDAQLDVYDDLEEQLRDKIDECVKSLSQDRVRIIELEDELQNKNAELERIGSENPDNSGVLPNDRLIFLKNSIEVFQNERTVAKFKIRLARSKLVRELQASVDRAYDIVETTWLQPTIKETEEQIAERLANAGKKGKKGKKKPEKKKTDKKDAKKKGKAGKAEDVPETVEDVLPAKLGLPPLPKTPADAYDLLPYHHGAPYDHVMYEEREKDGCLESGVAAKQMVKIDPIWAALEQAVDAEGSSMDQLRECLRDNPLAARSKTSHGSTPIHFLALADIKVRDAAMEALELMLEYPVDFEAVGENGDSVLHAAARVGNVPAMTALIEHPSFEPKTMHSRNGAGCTPFILVSNSHLTLRKNC